MLNLRCSYPEKIGAVLALSRLLSMWPQLGSEVDHGVNLLRTVPQQPLQVAHESIDVSFAPSLQDYVLVIIVSEPPGQLFIVHLWLVLPDAPSSSHLIRIDHLEFPTITSPGDKVLTCLVREELKQELPELDGTRASEAGSLLATDCLHRALLTGCWVGVEREV